MRDRLGESVHSIFFNKIIDLCKKQGLISEEGIIVDATQVNANASLESLYAIDKEQDIKEKEAIYNRSPLDPMPNKKISNKTHISRTDPDASLARKNGAPQKLKYKVHNAIDAKSRVIIDTHVTTGKVNESQIFPSLCLPFHY